MSKIYLHVGMHKTGSTAIQSAFHGFDDGQVRYADLGVINHSIPFFTAYSGKHQDYHIWQSAGLNAQQIEERKIACREAIQECVSSSRTQDLLFSGEDISLLPQAALSEIHALFMRHSKSTKVIIYVREPISFIASMHQEAIKSGVETVTPILPCYRFRIEKFFQVFGADNVVVRIYVQGQLYYDDIISDFAQAIDVSPPTTKGPANDSLSTEAVKVIFVLNQMVSAFGEVREVAMARDRMLSHVRRMLPGRFNVPAPLLEGLVDHDDVRWLFAETGIDFRLSSGSAQGFSKEALDSYLSELDAHTLNIVKDYLAQLCATSKAPNDTRFLLARYFMSFLSTDWLSSFKFDPQRYLELHPDVMNAGVDPYRHYVEQGLAEGRRID